MTNVAVGGERERQLDDYLIIVCRSGVTYFIEKEKQYTGCGFGAYHAFVGYPYKGRRGRGVVAVGLSHFVWLCTHIYTISCSTNFPHIIKELNRTAAPRLLLLLRFSRTTNKTLKNANYTRLESPLNQFVVVVVVVIIH